MQRLCLHVWRNIHCCKIPWNSEWIHCSWRSTKIWSKLGKSSILLDCLWPWGRYLSIQTLQTSQNIHCSKYVSNFLLSLIWWTVCKSSNMHNQTWWNLGCIFRSVITLTTFSSTCHHCGIIELVRVRMTKAGKKLREFQGTDYCRTLAVNFWYDMSYSFNWSYFRFMEEQVKLLNIHPTTATTDTEPLKSSNWLDYFGMYNWEINWYYDFEQVICRLLKYWLPMFVAVYCAF